MRAYFLLFIFALACVCGCANQSEPSIPIKPAAGPILIDASPKEQSWQGVGGVSMGDKRRIYGYVGFLWDERYLYLRVKCLLGKVLPETIKLRLQFAHREYLAPYEILITADGKCLNPKYSMLPLPELPSEDVTCKATSNDKNWEAEIRVSLMAIKALGNKVRLTAAISGMRRVLPKGKPAAFAGTRTGLMHFVYP